ncbi:peroxisomal membrane protein Lpx1p [[Candida] railenensis]|uniref:Peroxisomal membrane protein Lpx1p n=1 Tax=[Candida] railenensis TaxID=45579 RepID=A0A9P0VZE2_9ASCO|nr:peroxisomal membrane protein Lpx1p [[Candida] railenensis]
MFNTTSHKAPAAFPRQHGGTLLSTDHLELAYEKYTTTDNTIPSDFITFNLVFVHGNGMNKSVWKYYVGRLFEYAATTGRSEKWAIKSMVAMDVAVHGDSAILNKGKLGWIYSWDDGARDINALVKHEQQSSGDFIQDPRHRNIIVGHSLGGCQALFAVIFEPTLYDLAFTIDPVAYVTPQAGQKYFKILPLLDKVYHDTFQSEKDLEKYLRSAFLKNFHPEILDDIIKDEKYFDEEDGLYKTKASKPQQFAIYMGGPGSIPIVMKLMSAISTPVVHIEALRGKFNAPGTSDFIRSAIPKEYLKTIDLDGEHLINGEDPESILKCIKESLSERAATAATNISSNYYPEIVYNGDREKIFKSKWESTFVARNFGTDAKPKI